MATTKKKEFQVKIKNKLFFGISHGLKFQGGISEKFSNEELYNRLLAKGYEPVANAKSDKETEKA